MKRNVNYHHHQPSLCWIYVGMEGERTKTRHMGPEWNDVQQRLQIYPTA
jgi:hypothetical protein